MNLSENEEKISSNKFYILIATTEKYQKIKCQYNIKLDTKAAE